MNFVQVFLRSVMDTAMAEEDTTIPIPIPLLMKTNPWALK